LNSAQDGASTRAGVGPRLRPAAGEFAAGHGVHGVIGAVAAVQPLAAEGIWRVVLGGEASGRLVRGASGTCDGRDAAAWRLLQIDDLSDKQWDAYERVMSDHSTPSAVALGSPGLARSGADRP